MYDQVIKLVKVTKGLDDYGDLIETETTRNVFCEVKSVGMSEFYQSMANGLQPEIKFVIADFLDYQDEKKLKYTPFNSNEEKEYDIIRTYRTENTLEITCQRGINVGS